MHQSFARRVVLTVCAVAVSFTTSVLAQGPSSGAPDVTGKWVLTLDGSQGTIALNLVLKQTRQELTGTLGELHELTLVVEGAWREGKLEFTASGEGHGQAITLEFSGTLGKDGTLTGKASTAMGEMTWAAKRDMK